MKDFTGKYQISKTLRFELIPQGKTLQYINEKGLIEEDKERDISYKKMKKTIDGFHKDFIELAMSQVILTRLKDYVELYNSSPENKKQESFKKDLEKIQGELRKEVVKGFSMGATKDTFSKIDKKELITVELENWISENQNKEYYFDEKFKNFTTYFSGFHENRKNMYTDKEQSTAIAYRLIHENLPKFIDNLRIFQIALEALQKSEIEQIEGNLKELIKDERISDIFTLDYFNQTLTQKGIEFYNAVIGGYTEKGNIKRKGLNESINLYNQKQEKINRIPKLKMLYKQILRLIDIQNFYYCKFNSLIISFSSLIDIQPSQIS